MFRTSWPKMEVLGQNRRVARCWPRTNSILLLGGFTSVPISVKIYREMRPRECAQTDRCTDAQTQTSFIISPMLYAVAMGQIINASRVDMYRYLKVIRRFLLWNRQAAVVCHCLHVSYAINRFRSILLHRSTNTHIVREDVCNTLQHTKT